MTYQEARLWLPEIWCLAGVQEELLKENFSQEPTERGGGCGIFTTAKDPEYVAAFYHVEM